MTVAESLIKSNPLLPAENYEALRKQGFRSIEKLSSDIWTEYNESDPGITILEAVSYAITDLAYRTGFDIKDLLSPEKDAEMAWKNIFYTARQILHNSPLTLSDYRKIMIDVKGVRNAWIEPSKDYEAPIWIDYNYFSRKQNADCSCENKETLNCFGKLKLEPASLTQFESWKETRSKEIKIALMRVLKFIADSTAKINQTEERKKEGIKAGKTVQLDKLKKQLLRLADEKKALDEELDLLNKKEFIPSKIVELEGLYNVMIEYEEDVLKEHQREAVRQRVYERLMSQRNLCEDFLSINAVEYADVGLGATVVLEEFADPDTVLAEMFFILYSYFTPSIPFHTINQMMEKGKSIDEIFEGPALVHGFIDTDLLARTDLFRDIRLSDIVNELADIKGVKAITYLNMPFTGFESIEPVDQFFFSDWINQLKEKRMVARVLPQLSSVIFCKEHDFITYNTGKKSDRNTSRMLKMFEDLKNQDRHYKLEGHQTDLPVPAGENMDLTDFFPVTYSLPACYGVSERAGLPATASTERKIQSWQLKGYLLFFEQIMSDYLQQLNHLGTLFSFEDLEKKTYFTKVLADLQDIQLLIIDHAGHGPGHFDRVLIDFSNVLQNIVETPSLYQQRRNTFLDHLLARFSENMDEYEALSRWLTPDGIEERLIQNKTAILKSGQYYKISTERGKAFNYSLPKKVWDTSNVSGAERRIGRLLGFADTKRRNLSPEFIQFKPVMIAEEQKKSKSLIQKSNSKGDLLNVIQVFDPCDDEKLIITSIEVAEGCCTESLFLQILTLADNRKNIRFHDEPKQRSKKEQTEHGSFWFEVLMEGDDGIKVVLAYSPHFTSRAERNHAYEAFRQAIDKLNNNEGLHLLEHLLLRPRFEKVFSENNEPMEVILPDVCLNECDIKGRSREKTQLPVFQKKISRIPDKICFNKMPWVLEYLTSSKMDDQLFDLSLLFGQTYVDGSDPVHLTFGHYESMVKRVQDLVEFGSERIHYTIVSNIDYVEDPFDRNLVKYAFIIHDEEGKILAQSPYIFNRRTKEEIETKAKIDMDIEDFINALMTYFGFELDLYCEPDPCNSNEDPFSFRCTVVLPCWPSRLRDDNFRNLVEKTIHAETPAHVHVNIQWIGIMEMKLFETRYHDWLQELADAEMPSYEYANPLVQKLNSIQPCGCCEDDCSSDTSQHSSIPIK